MENTGEGVSSVKLKVKAHLKKKSFNCWHKVQLALGIKTTNKKTFFRSTGSQEPARKFLKPTDHKDINT